MQVLNWGGVTGEWDLLKAAVDANCACGYQTPYGPPTCAAHELLTSQRKLNGLAFARRIADRLRAEEFCQAA